MRCDGITALYHVSWSRRLSARFVDPGLQEADAGLAEAVSGDPDGVRPAHESKVVARLDHRDFLVVEGEPVGAVAIVLVLQHVEGAVAGVEPRVQLDHRTAREVDAGLLERLARGVGNLGLTVLREAAGQFPVLSSDQVEPVAIDHQHLERGANVDEAGHDSTGLGNVEQGLVVLLAGHPAHLDAAVGRVLDERVAEITLGHPGGVQAVVVVQHVLRVVSHGAVLQIVVGTS